MAPYEADAQLAFLSLAGIADLIISEDSDLAPFGCDKILCKMDTTGNGTLVSCSFYSDANLLHELAPPNKPLR